jgi:hypothetical protein
MTKVMYEFKAEKRKELSDILKNVKKFGGEEILAKDDYPSSYCLEEVYFIKSCAVLISHNLSDNEGPSYYLYMTVYGKPPDEVAEWLKKLKSEDISNKVKD